MAGKGIGNGKGIGIGTGFSLPLPLPAFLPVSIPLLILIFGLFMTALHPTITAGDSGEITAAAFSLGIPHPPGYPLYVSIAKSFTHALPLGNMAYRVNIASALLGAASCLVVYLITLKIIKPGVRSQESGPTDLNLPAFFAAASLALSHEFRYRSTVAEVYTLNAFVVLMIIYIMLIWREKSSGQGMEGMERGLSLSGGTGILPVITGWKPVPPTGTGTVPGSVNSRLLFLAAFIFGLGVGNHHTIVLVMPGALGFVLWNSWKSGPRSWKLGANALSLVTRHLPLTTIFFLLGLSIYLYLPARSFKNPFMDWGDPQNLHNFIDVFTRKSYLPQELERGWEMLVKQLKTFNPIHEFTFIGFLFGIFGIRGLWKADKVLAAMLLVTFILTSYGLILLAGSSTKDVDILKKFYLPAYTVFSILIGSGIAACLNPPSPPFAKGGMGGFVLRLTLLSLAAASLIWQLASHYPLTRNSDNYLAYDYGMNELKSLHTGSVYINKGNIKTFPLWYLQGVEGYREDVKLVAAYFLTQGWHAKETLRLAGAFLPSEGGSYEQMLIDAIYRGNAEKGVYTGFLDEEYIPGRLFAYTNGITFMLHEAAKGKHGEDVWPLYQLRGVREIEKRLDRGIVEILKDYASSYYNTGLEYYNEGDMDRAMMAFEKAVAINPEDPDFLNNLAALYADQGVRLKEAEAMAGKAVELYVTGEDKGLAAETLKEIQEIQKEKGRI